MRVYCYGSSIGEAGIFVINILIIIPLQFNALGGVCRLFVE